MIISHFYAVARCPLLLHLFHGVFCLFDFFFIFSPAPVFCLVDCRFLLLLLRLAFASFQAASIMQGGGGGGGGVIGGNGLMQQQQQQQHQHQQQQQSLNTSMVKIEAPSSYYCSSSSSYTPPQTIQTQQQTSGPTTVADHSTVMLHAQGAYSNSFFFLFIILN